MSELRCCDCRWWETDAEPEFTELDDGECHRYPPNVACIAKVTDLGIAIPEVIRGAVLTTHPTTYALEWCGEFEEREEA